jgi:hypothetical protein
LGAFCILHSLVKDEVLGKGGAFCILHSLVKDEVLGKGSLVQTAKMFSVDGSTMQIFWREMEKNGRL